MFERMTEHARATMVLARHISIRMNHESIGTEHILLGLIEEHKGVAAAVMERLGYDLASIRKEVEKQAPASEIVPPERKDPHYTPCCKHTLEQAGIEAEKLSHHYTGSEHLLLGMLRDEEGIAGKVLRNAGLTIEAAVDGIHDYVVEV